VLARHAAATVGVGTCWPWETAAMLPPARPREAVRRPLARRGVGAYRGGCPPTAYFKLWWSIGNKETKKHTTCMQQTFGFCKTGVFFRRLLQFRPGDLKDAKRRTFVECWRRIFSRPDALSWAESTVSKHWRGVLTTEMQNKHKLVKRHCRNTQLNT